LSLNALKNWHQNKGAKRREVISDWLIGPSGYVACRHCPEVALNSPGAQGQRCITPVKNWKYRWGRE
jgi:hypothetical protein